MTVPTAPSRRIAKWCSLPALMCAAFLVVMSEPPLEAQAVTYQPNPAGFSPDPDAFVAVAAPGICRLDGVSTGNGNVPHGGFVKLNGSVLIDTATQITGNCDWFLFLNYWYSQPRDIDRVESGIYPPVSLPSGHTFWGPWNPTRQEYDSRTPTNGASASFGTDLFEEGSWNFTFKSVAFPTACALPTDSAVVGRLAHAVACAPKWNMILGAPLHAPAGDIFLYVPASMWGDLHTAAEAAAAELNASLTGIINVSVVSSDCGTGGDCLKFDENSTGYSGCAQLAGPSSWDHSTGEVQSERYIDLPTSPSWRNWRSRSPERLKRSVAHEVSHALGLGHYESCALKDSIMTEIPGTWPDADKCSTTDQDATMAVSPTPSDILPISQSTYGLGVRVTCGF